MDPNGYIGLRMINGTITKLKNQHYSKNHLSRGLRVSHKTPHLSRPRFLIPQVEWPLEEDWRRHPKDSSRREPRHERRAEARLGSPLKRLATVGRLVSVLPIRMTSMRGYQCA